MTVRTVTSRVLLLALGVALALVLVEGLLQFGALGLRLTGREVDSVGLTTRHRIVTIGDSNTYGVMVERDQAYPRVLESCGTNRDCLPS